MNVHLEPVEGAKVETYRVRMMEQDNESERVVIGVAARMSPTEWAFHPSRDTDDDINIPMSPADVSITLQAKDRDELESVIATRFGAIEIPADRLRFSTMEQLCGTMLTAMNALASHTRSLPGFSTALAGSIARMIVEDIKPGTDSTFKTGFMNQVETQVEAIRSVNHLRAHLVDALGSMFKTAHDEDDSSSGPSGKSGPTTH